MLITIAANCVVLIITTPLPMQDNSSLNRKLVSLVVFLVNRNYKRKFYEVFVEVTLVESILSSKQVRYFVHEFLLDFRNIASKTSVFSSLRN